MHLHRHRDVPLMFSSLARTNTLQLVMFQLCQHPALMGAISSVFQTYAFLCVAELQSWWCDETGCKAFIEYYDMFIMSLAPRGIYCVSRMTCYLFTSSSFARFACHCACYSTVYRCVWMCLCERDRGSKIKGSWQHFYKFRKQLHSLKPMNTETKRPDMSYES